MSLADNPLFRLTNALKPLATGDSESAFYGVGVKCREMDDGDLTRIGDRMRQGETVGKACSEIVCGTIFIQEEVKGAIDGEREPAIGKAILAASALIFMNLDESMFNVESLVLLVTGLCRMDLEFSDLLVYDLLTYAIERTNSLEDASFVNDVCIYAAKMPKERLRILIRMLMLVYGGPQTVSVAGQIEKVMMMGADKQRSPPRHSGILAGIVDCSDADRNAKFSDDFPKVVQCELLSAPEIEFDKRAGGEEVAGSELMFSSLYSLKLESTEIRGNAVFDLVAFMGTKVSDELKIAFIESLSNLILRAMDIRVATFYFALAAKWGISTLNFHLLKMVMVFPACANFFETNANEFEVVNYARASSFSCLYEHHRDCINQVLNMAGKVGPFLWAEVLARMCVTADQAGMEGLVSIDLMDSVFKVLAEVKGRRCRSSIAIFINRIVEFGITITEGLPNRVMLESDFALLLTPSIREFIMLHVRSFLMECSKMSGSLAVLGIYCGGILRIGASEEVYKDVGSDVLAIISDILSKRTDLMPFFEPVISPMLLFIDSHADPESWRISLNFLSEFVVHNNSFMFSDVQVRSLYSVAKRLENGASDTLLLVLISIMAGSRVNDVLLSGRFLIHDPTLILIIFSLYIDSTFPVVGFFMDLCEYSTFNVVQCHNGGLDAFLIRLMRKYPDPTAFNGYVLDHRLSIDQINNKIAPLLMNIARLKTTAQSVYEFIGFMVPRGKGGLKPFADKVMSLLTGDFARGPGKPEVRLEYLNSRSVVQSNEVPLQKTLSEGLLYNAWVLNDCVLSERNNKAEPILLNIQDTTNNQITLALKNGAVFCEFIGTNGSKQNQSILLATLDSNKWEMISFSIVAPKPSAHGQIEISFSINAGEMKKQSVIGPRLRGPGLAVEIGGFSSRVSLRTPFCFLGQYHVGVGRLESTVIDAFFNHGSVLKPAYDTIYRVEQPLKFLRPMSVIVKQYPVYKLLIPFFEYGDSLPDGFLDMAVDLLASIADLTDFPYFPVIGLLLKKSSAKILTAALYRKFYDWYLTCTSAALLSSIILHFGIWCKASDTELADIAQCWLRVVRDFPRVISFRRILVYMRVYFWFEPIEGGSMAITQDRNTDMNVTRCRDDISKVLIEAAKTRYTNVDASYLVSHIVSCRDNRQVISLLGLFRTLPRLPDDGQYIEHLLKVMDTANPDVFVAGLITVLDLGDPQTLADVISARLRRHHFTLEVLALLVDHLDGFPDILGIMSLIAVNIGVTARETYLEGLRTLLMSPNLDQKFVKGTRWFVWPIIVGVNFGVDVQEEIVVLIARAITELDTVNLLDLALGLLDVICVSCQEPASFMRARLLALLMDSCVDITPFARNLIPRCVFHMFFSLRPMMCDLMSAEFSKCPYPVEVQEWKGNCNIKSMKDLLSVLGSVVDRDRQFHIDVEEDGTVSSSVLFASLVRLLRIDTYVPVRVELMELADIIMQRMRSRRATHFDWTDMINDINLKTKRYVSGFRIEKMPAIAASMYSEFHDIVGSRPRYICADIAGLGTTDVTKILESARVETVNANRAWRDLTKVHMPEYSVWKNVYAVPKSGQSQRITYKLLRTRMKRVRDKIQRLQGDAMDDAIATFQALLVEMNKSISISLRVLEAVLVMSSEDKDICISFDDITAVLKQHSGKETSMELITASGRNYLLDFCPMKASEVVRYIAPYLNARTMVETTLTPEQVTEMGITKKWVAREITTLSYLMQLNCLGHRTYKQVGLYPVMPNARGNESLIIQPLALIQRFFTKSEDFEAFLEQEKYQYTPEFYFFFEAFAGLVSDPLKFVYSNRKWLENDDSIPEWIDRTFGVRQNESFTQESCLPQMFTEPHPKRVPIVQPRFRHLELKLPRARSFMERGCINMVDGYLLIYVCTTGNVLYRYKLKPFDVSPIVPSEQKLNGDVLLARIEGGVALVESEKICLVADGVDHENFKNAAKSNKYVDASRHFVVCGNDDGYFYVCDGAKLCCSFSICPHIPICVCVSAERKLVAVGTSSGTVLVFDLTNGGFFQTLKLGKRQLERIVISNEYGFTVCFCEGEIVTFTENGTEMYRKEHNDTAVHCETFTFLDGSDFIIFSNAKNEVFHFEIFNPKVTRITSFDSSVIDLIYVNSLKCIICITEKYLHFVPFMPVAG